MCVHGLGWWGAVLSVARRRLTVAAMPAAPCTWDVDWTCLPNVEELEADDDRVRLQAAVDTAVMVLWALTGRQFGVCATTVRPCPHQKDRRWSDTVIPGIGWIPVLDAGVWRSMALCTRSSCTADSLSVVELPGHVQDVVEVIVDGVVIAPSSYRLEGSRLYRAGGRDWPAQDLGRPAGDLGTWSVTYNQGWPPPAGAAAMVGALAREFWAMCSGGKCRLPRRVTSVSRQGVTFQMVDPTDIYQSGQTGLPEVDLWVTAINPNHLSSPSQVMSPEVGVL